MEGLPRMPMLSVELKFCPASTDFGQKLKEYIAQFYEENPETYSKEIEELNQLRDGSIKAPADFTGCGTLKKYFAQLHLLKSRFPMEENDAACVPFTWYEKFSDMPSPVTYEDIRYELACILHNIGAVHSYLATIDSRLTSDGMKVSCTHFQCAAWAFQTMRDDAEPFRVSASLFSPDFDRNILDWYTVLMLAQAQECILEKSLVDNRKSLIIAKVSAQVSDYYAQAIRILEQPSVSDVVGSSKCRSWRKFVEMKKKFYRAVALYELGTQSDEQQKMGERLAYFQAAANELADATKLGHKDSSESIQQSLQFAEDVIGGRLNNAKKENDFIYHEKIPSLDSLPDLKGASLVKAIPFDPLDAEVSGGDIFKRLIPLEVHRTSSLYSEEKAKLLRRVSDDVEAKNKSLDEFMTSLKIDQLKLDVDFNQLPLPDVLIERCAAFNAKPSAVSDLIKQMTKLTDISQDVELMELDIEKKIDQNDKESKNIILQMYGAADEDHQAKLPNDIRASIIVRLKTFRDELEKYSRAREQATKANVELHKALAAHSENLHSLSLPLFELKKHLPSPSHNLAELPETMEMKRILAKVEEMKRQRDMLMEQFRQQIRDDDVTKILLAAKDKDEQEVFAKEVKKHEKQVGIIDQNLSAQENIIKALTEANAKYGEIRKQTNAAIKQREAKIMNLVGAYDVYVDLELKSKEGIEFYERLKKSFQEIDMNLSKWSETELEIFRSKNKMELEKKATAALEARKAAAISAAAPSMVNEPSGPKLKDYMAYYRAKKAGQAGAFPPPAGPNPTYPVAMTGGVPQQQHFMPDGSGQWSAAGTTMPYSMPTATNGNFSMAGTNENYSTSGASGTFPTYGANVVNYQMTSTNGTYPSGGTNGTYQPTGAYQPSGSNSGSFPTSQTYSTIGTTAAYPMAGTSGNGPMPTNSGQHYAMPNMGTALQHQPQQPPQHQPQHPPQHQPQPQQQYQPQQPYQQQQQQTYQQQQPYQQQPMNNSNIRPDVYMPTNTIPGNQYSIPCMTTTTGMISNTNPMQSMVSNMNTMPQNVSTMSANTSPGSAMNTSSTNLIPTPAISQNMPNSGFGYNSIYLEPVSSGSDYAQLRWRYDGPKPAKYMITFRGYQRYDAGMGRWEEREVDTGAPVKLDAEHYIANNLRPDTTYAFEVSVIDESNGRIYVRSPTVRVSTNSSLL